MGKIPTVAIQDGDDYIVINESEYDPEKHTLYAAGASDSGETPKPSLEGDQIDPPTAGADDENTGEAANTPEAGEGGAGENPGAAQTNGASEVLTIETADPGNDAGEASGGA